MIKRDDIVSYCNDVLDLHAFRDYGPMGLQFTGKDEVTKIGTAVSINQEVIDKAAQNKVDLLLVHHGLFWNNEPRYLDERMKRRLSSLEFHNISVLAYHLALDAHPDIGNNIAALSEFDGQVRKFGDIGWGKKLTRPYRKADLSTIQFDHALNGERTILYPYGPTQIRKVAAVVGGAPFYIHDAVREGYDLFITGEAAEPSMALAKELGINFLALGHYNSEKSGVQILGWQTAMQFGLTHEFLDVPNPV